ncbi:hypothetical protein DPEC_G00272520 [Dallia pectoralis]|uniref:Uncharacterized protein n=1 Tax=Dallia pectoralis TaxID=75939 RepID=A0ACC2FQ14_DALPE|nr:hypothetical protein DPEC_G00272520 [Dallia pectoralis]
MKCFENVSSHRDLSVNEASDTAPTNPRKEKLNKYSLACYGLSQEVVRCWDFHFECLKNNPSIVLKGVEECSSPSIQCWWYWAAEVLHQPWVCFGGTHHHKNHANNIVRMVNCSCSLLVPSCAMCALLTVNI